MNVPTRRLRRQFWLTTSDLNSAPAFASMASGENILLELESKQDDVLARLDELNARIEALIASESLLCQGVVAGDPATGTSE